MTREAARERLLDYAYGEMSPADAAAFEFILRDDPELQAELDEVAVVRRAASELPALELPASARRRILAEADRAVRRQAWALRWDRLQAFVLSPAFAGAAVVVVAAVVGIQVLIQHGPADLWTSPDRMEEVVAPALGGAGVEATVVVASESGEQAAEVGPATEGLAEPAIVGQSEPATVGQPEPTEPSTLARGVAPSRDSKAEEAPAEASGRSGKVDQVAPRKSASTTRAPTRAKRTEVASADRRQRQEDAATSVGRERTTNERGRAESESDADTEMAHPAPAPAARAKAVDSLEGARAASLDDSLATDAVALLTEARQARGTGLLADALALCRRALDAGPTGGLLADVLAEAADVALELSRPAEAERYLNRLERLPGGTARAATIRGE